MRSDGIRRWATTWGPTIVVVALLSALAARRYLGIAQSDAILPSLMSTQRLTLFYWGQDRLANLLPLLAIAVRDEVWNFRFQSFLVGCAFFGLIAAVVAFHLRRTGRTLPPLMLAGVALASGLLVIAPYRELTGYRLVFEQLYSVSTGLFLLAVWVFLGIRRPWLGVAVMQVAMLLNPSLLLMAPFVWLLDFDPIGRMRRTAIVAAAMAATFAITNLLSARFGGSSQTGSYSTFRLGSLDDGAEAAARNLYHSVTLTTVLAIGIAALAVIAVRWATFPRRLQATYVCTPVFGTGWLLLFATNDWVRVNLYDFRYFFPLYMAIAVAVAVAVAEVGCALHARTPVRTRQAGSSAPWAAVGWLLAAGASCAVALAIIARVDVVMFESTRAQVAAAERYDAKLVVGSYIVTWPLVVQARADGLDVLGVSTRSEAIEGAIDDAVDLGASTRRSLRVLCADLDRDPCVEQLAQHTDTGWRVERVLSPQPLVLELSPVT